MDPAFIDESNDIEAQTMVAAMGFSGFGKKGHLAKKRKFNLANDAFIEGDELAKLDKGGKKGQGSGGNTMPLGKTRVFGAATSETVEIVAGKEKENGDEIYLDNDGKDGGPNYIVTSLLSTAESEGPHYIDTSLPPPIESRMAQFIDYRRPPEFDEEATEVQARINALLTRIQSGEMGDSSTASPVLIPKQLPQRPAGDNVFMQRVARPGSFSDQAIVASRSRPNHRGQRNEFWYIDYYDPSFNENPWERLEKSKGLEPLGTWPESPGR